MGYLSFLREHPKTFDNIIVHPVQTMMESGVFFRGGPDWPYFYSQVFARHCWGRIPWPIDRRPHPADHAIESLDRAVWCGPIINHFGHMVADFGMRIANSSRIDPRLPLLFSLPTTGRTQPPDFFWQVIDHFGIDRNRVMLVHRPLRVARLLVFPQAERRFGGSPSAAHLDMMQAISRQVPSADRDVPCVFISRALRRKGHFAGESYLDEAFAATGVTVFHPELVDLQAQLRLYRRAQCLIFSEGSAVYALQLMGRLGVDVVVLARRPWGHIAASSLRPRVRSLRYLRALRGLVYGLRRSGSAEPDTGISILDEERCIAACASIGIDLLPFWDSKTYIERRDADITNWVARRMARPAHSREAAVIEARLRALSVHI